MSWTSEKIAAAPRLQRKGMTLREIAAQFEVPIEDVTLLLFGGVAPTIAAPTSAPATSEAPVEKEIVTARPTTNLSMRNVPTQLTHPPKPRRRPVPTKTAAPAPAPDRRIPLVTVKTDPHADLVADFVARNGVRRFEPGASGTPQGMRYRLEAHGYEVKLMANGARVQIKAPGPRHRWQIVPLKEMTAIVDRLRTAEGMEPVARKGGKP